MPAHAQPAAASAERLQKAMAAAGVGSRRHCEELIRAGRVEVERQVVRQLGTRVDPTRQEIRVDGLPLPRQARVYYLVNKPPGVVSTNDDPAGRTRVIDLVPTATERLFTVGRLDMSSEGLILVTNDGELANQLAHPRYGVEKTYHVLVAGTPEREVLARLRQGVHLAEGWAHVTSVRVRKTFKQSTLLEIVLAEGRNREIRRLLAKVGHKVLRLKRVAIGGLRLKDLAPGDFRRLRGDELRLLKRRPRPPRRTHRPPDSAPQGGADELAQQPSLSAANEPAVPKHRGHQPAVHQPATRRPPRRGLPPHTRRKGPPR